MPGPKKRRSRARREGHDVKDRLIQTRVPERLESVLKEEAKKRRLTVSHLIRNMLEDTLDLVDTVVLGAGDLVDTAGSIADQVKRDAGKIALTAREAVRGRGAGGEGEASKAEAAPAAPKGKSEPPPSPRNGAAALDAVLAWNRVVVNRPARCARCGTELPRGSEAYLGLSQEPGAPPAWLCSACLSAL